jgi:acetyltransferase
VLRAQRRPLSVFFSPHSVAVIGATETPGSVGRTLIQNLIASPFGGAVFPVNPKRAHVLGIKAYPSVTDVPDPVDLAVIATPAPTVPDVLEACAAAGVPGAVIISAGFKETGAAGADLEKRSLQIARQGGMRLIGPNCLGVMSPLTGLNATFAQAMALPGKVALVSQSGALLTAILDVSLREQVGFSHVLSLGSMLDVGWGDVIDYLGSDARTQSIVLYMESIGDARAFLSAAREVALAKPIIVIKAGRSELGARAAASHTGALTGSDEVLDAAFRRVGVLRVAGIDDLFSITEVLATQPTPPGPRLAILTNAGGPGVLATDALILNGGSLAELAPETRQALDAILPPHWSHGNPVDVLGDADPERYAKALEIVGRDPGSDGLLVILTPQAMTDPTGTAEQLKPYAHLGHKPVLASWMGGASVAAGEAILNRAGIPSFAYPDSAARMFNYLWRYSYNLRGLYETPALDSELVSWRVGESISGPHQLTNSPTHQVRSIVEAARAAGRTLLTEPESKAVLAAYGIPTVPTQVARTEEEAVQAAEAFGYPVVLKIYSETITHKTDVGGVRLNLPDAAAVRAAYQGIHAALSRTGASSNSNSEPRELPSSSSSSSSIPLPGAGDFLGVTVQPMVRLEGYELILGSSLDPQFGPVLLFGAGGQLVEVIRDRALGLPPLTTTLARRMMEQTRILRALQGVRGRAPVDLEALERLMVRFSELVVTQPAIREIDINPLLASPEQLLALDARVVLHPPGVPDEQLPRPAIRPYPSQYVQEWRSAAGTPMVLRPIRPEDEPLLVQFHQGLSERSVYLRYFYPFQLSQRVAHERLLRICFIDYDRELALVAECRNADGDRFVVAVGRLSKIPLTATAEWAILVSDPYQRQGLGTELLRQLVRIARAEDLERMTAEILADNTPMQQVARRLGFTLRPLPDDPRVMRAELLLGDE